MYENIVLNSNINSGTIVQTLKTQIASNAAMQIATGFPTQLTNIGSSPTTTTQISITASDIDAQPMASYLLYLDPSPLEDKGIRHTIQNSLPFATNDVLNGAGTFASYTGGLASGVTLSSTAIQTPSVYAHAKYGNVQRVTFNFSTSASATAATITLPAISNTITKQALFLRYRIHASANATITANFGTLTADDSWHVSAYAITSPYTPVITVTTNVANDAAQTIVDIADVYAYNLDSTSLPTEVASVLSALTSRAHTLYQDMQSDSLSYCTMYASVPSLPFAIQAAGSYNAFITATANTVAGVATIASTGTTTTVTLSDSLGNTTGTYSSYNTSPFTFTKEGIAISSFSGTTATLSATLASGLWHIYYPANITIQGAVISQQNTTANGVLVNTFKQIPISITIPLVWDVGNTMDELPDNYAAQYYIDQIGIDVTFTIGG